MIGHIDFSNHLVLVQYIQITVVDAYNCALHMQKLKNPLLIIKKVLEFEFIGPSSQM